MKGEAGASGEGSGVWRKKGVRWWRMCRSTGSSTRRRVHIRFGTNNICNYHNRGLELALRGMYQAKTDLGIFQETKVTDGIYTRGLAGYIVVATDATSRHRYGVAVFYRTALNFAVEAIRQFGPNVVSFQMATGERRWYIMGCYLTPNETSKI